MLFLKPFLVAITEDETFTTDISGATGTVVDFTAPLLKYTATTSSLEVTDTVTFSGGETAIVAKSDPLTGTTAIAYEYYNCWKYISEDGHISELTKKIQDSLYYQDYSYVIKVSESINKWRDALKRAVHPSGFYVTGEVNIATLLCWTSKTTSWFYNIWWIVLRHFRQSNLHEIEYSIQHNLWKKNGCWT